MTTYRLPPGAGGVDLEGGGHYKGSGSRKRGATVTIDDPAHQRAMDRAGAVAGNLHKVGFTAPAGLPSRRCEPCDFTAYSWQTECPRCGHTTTEVS